MTAAALVLGAVFAARGVWLAVVSVRDARARRRVAALFERDLWLIELRDDDDDEEIHRLGGTR